MFYFDRGLFLRTPGLAVDVPRRQPQGFISHAHTDHVARHELALCTPETALLYQHRFGQRDVRTLPYGEPLQWGGVTLTTFPAGHCLGSAMLLAEERGRRLLYTGDFKLSASRTAGAAKPPRADILVIESTFGDPRYRFPKRAAVEATLVEIVRDALRAGAVPVVYAYALGKAQEVTRILTDAGIGVLQHKSVFAISRVYAECGVELGKHDVFHHQVPENHAVVLPPRAHQAASLPRRKIVSIAATGWAIDPRAARRWCTDHAVPLSDHADFDELVQAVRQVGAERVYCTHGPESFVECLCDLGLPAERLGKRVQMRLF
ncbi:MAG: MBL fold metallo-hydrolase [Planctomycetia bacterium]|nr:MBL fold metallo-hydrolase [Planctomycetia bacterium]